MRKTLVAAAVVTLAFTGAALAQGKMYSSAGGAAVCMKVKGTGATNCIFPTMAQCLMASNHSRDGDCVANPWLVWRSF